MSGTNKKKLDRPVVVMHGIMSQSGAMKDMKEMIKREFDSPMVYLVDLTPEPPSWISKLINHFTKGDYDEVERSTTPMWGQVEALRKYLQSQTVPPNTKGAPSLATLEGGFDVICHSQGGILFRGYMAKYADHNVHTFIALSSPLMGQFGISRKLTKRAWNITQGELSTDIMYSDIAQENLSLAGYWKDPTRLPEYRSKCKYLSNINNEEQNPEHDDSHQHRTNLGNVNRIVLISGPDDGVITPWQSAMFEYYKDNTTDSIVPFSQNQQLNSTIGIDAFIPDKNLFRYKIVGVKHEYWDNNVEVFRDYVAPNLLLVNVPSNYV